MNRARLNVQRLSDSVIREFSFEIIMFIALVFLCFFLLAAGHDADSAETSNAFSALIIFVLPVAVLAIRRVIIARRRAPH